MIVKTVKVTDKGQISIPVEVREKAHINVGDDLILLQEGDRIFLEKPEHIIKDDFKDLLKHTESVAKKLWDNKHNDIWDTA